jgi:Ca2+-binding EF-hand superfamily protein
MDRNTRFALLIGAAVIIGGSGLAFAQMNAAPAPQGPVQRLVRHRLMDRMFADFDTNHDGKITRVEFDAVLAERFATATHGGRTMTAEQFASIRHDDFVKRTTAMFHRLNWSGNGQLTLEEFAAPQRVRFQRMDRDGSGTVSCSPVQRADFHGKPSSPPDGPQADAVHGGGMRDGWRGRGGYGRLCDDAGVNGSITRSAFDQITLKKFQQASDGSATMTLEQFIASKEPRYRDMSDRMFKRLDKANDGKLTLAEFTAPQDRMFVILDRDSNGYITQDELRPHGGPHGHRGPGGPGGPGDDHDGPPHDGPGHEGLDGDK